MRSCKDKEAESRKKEQQRELHSVCSGLIRLIISLSLPGPSPELAYTGTHVFTNTHACIHTYARIKDRERERSNE